MVDGLFGKMIKIFIPVETTAREFTYKVILAAKLCSELNVECYVGSKSQIKNLMKFSKNFIYLDKGYHENVSETLYKQIKDKKGIILNLDEEGAIDYEDLDVLNIRYSKNLFEFASKVFIWGNAQKDKLKIKSNKIITTGHPRFELLKPNYFPLYKDEINTITKFYRDFILINTNMGFGNNLKGDEYVIKNYGERFRNINEIILNDQIKLKEINKVVNALSKKNYTVVIRPHPEESLEYYENIFKEFKNINVVKKFSSIPWLICAKNIIHFDCTTGIESLMLGKKSISYVPNTLNNKLLANLAISSSIRVNTINELQNELDKKKLIQDLDKTLLDDYFNFSQVFTIQEVFNRTFIDLYLLLMNYVVHIEVIQIQHNEMV